MKLCTMRTEESSAVSWENVSTSDGSLVRNFKRYTQQNLCLVYLSLLQ